MTGHRIGFFAAGAFAALSGLGPTCGGGGGGAGDGRDGPGSGVGSGVGAGGDAGGDGGRDAGAGGDVAAGPRLDEALHGQARAGVITRSEELIAGPLAKGRLGDVRIYNERVAYVIEAVGASDGYNLYGGGIVDAAVLGDDGRPGPTLWGEILVGVNILQVEADRVAVTADGADGGPARVKVEGKGAPFELLGEMLTPPDMPGPMWIEYVLHPGADALEMTVGFTNGATAPVDVPHVELGFMFGDGAAPYAPGEGFDLGDTAGSLPWYGAFGQGVGYRIAWDGGPLRRLLSVVGVVLASVPGGLVAPGASLERRFFVEVGRADRAAEAPPGSPETAAPTRVVAEVVDAAGGKVGGVWVHAARAGRLVGFAVTDAGGRAELALASAEGALELVAAAPGGGEVRAAVEAGAATSDPPVVTLALPATGELRFKVTDEAGAQPPVRVDVRRLDGPAARTPAPLGGDRAPGGLATRLYPTQGEGSLDLPPGEYEVTVGRGFEYTVAQRTVTIRSGAASDVALSIERVVDTTGWVSADFHLHAQGSPDSSDLNDLKVAALAGEGLETPVSTDHDNIVDWQPAVEAMGLGAWLRMGTGEEVTTYAYGHFNVFPLEPDAAAPNGGAFRWYGLDAPDLFSAVREAVPAGGVIQVNHPRSNRFAGYMENVGWNPETGAFTSPGQLSLDFDAMEVANGKRSGRATDEQGFRDWIGLVGRGKRVTATGNSDSHHAMTSLVGFPRNYLEVGKDDPADVTPDEVAAAVLDGRVGVSAGPFLTASIVPREAGGQTGGAWEIAVRAQAPPWMGLNRVYLVVDGVPAEEGDALGRHRTLPAPTGEVVRLDEVFVVEAERDAFVVVVAEGDDPMDPLYPGALPFAFTNALYIDADGDGAWTPPGGALDVP